MGATADAAWVYTDTKSGQQYIVSTKKSQLDISFIQWAFESEQMGWAKRLSTDLMDTMLDNSLNYGLYQCVDADINGPDLTPERALLLRSENLRQIGFSRVVTDYVTFAWVTDVVVNPEFQGSGLGRFMIQCVGESLDQINQGGALRRSMLMTNNPKVGVDSYNKLLGMMVVEQGKNNLVVMTTTGK